MDGVAVKPLTVDFHEGGFLSKLNQESKLGFWSQLSDDEKKQAGSPWGPANPQALNRYSYVQNNPLKWVDPSGHYISMSYEEALYLRELMNPMMDELAAIAKSGSDTIALGTAIASGLGGYPLHNRWCQPAG